MTASRNVLVATLLLVASLVAVASSASLWDGQWTDRSGLGVSQYICADEASRTFSGLYSEAGVLIGNLTSNYRGAKGNWYEAGLGSCTSGTFEIYLSPDGNSFTGLYTCSDDPTQEVSIFETRIDSDRPSDDECANIARTVVTLDGRYVTGDNVYAYDLCTSGSSLTGSVDFALQLTTDSASDESSSSSLAAATGHGYLYGNNYEFGNVFKAFAYSPDMGSFAALGIRSGRNYNIYFWCVRNSIGRAQGRDFDSQCQISQTAARTGTTTPEQCARNQGVLPGASSSQIIVPSASASSSSDASSSPMVSTLAVAALAALAVVAALF